MADILKFKSKIFTPEQLIDELGEAKHKIKNILCVCIVDDEGRDRVHSSWSSMKASELSLLKDMITIEILDMIGRSNDN